MSVGVARSGAPNGSRSATARVRRILVAAVVAGAAILPGAAPAAAANGLELATDFPAVVVAPGTDLSFDIKVQSDRLARVGLAVDGAPQGWTAKLFGGGHVVDGVSAGGAEAPVVRLDVTVPAEATGTHRITVTASDGSREASLPLDLRVDASAAGDLTLTTDFPQLRGPSDQEYSFNLTLRNDTAEDLTFAVNATGPQGWEVATQITGEAQAASAIVEAGSTRGVEVSVTPPSTVDAGSYPVEVVATAGSRQIKGSLAVEITGSYEMDLTTPDERLNASGEAGRTIELPMVVENNGTTALEAVDLSGTGPTGWTIEFDPAQVASVAPNSRGDVIARITPSGDAISGDYVVTLKGENDQATISREIRVTVQTSQVWGLIGIGLIVLVVGGLLWVFRVYGRR